MHEESPFKSKTGPARIWGALFHSVDGFKAAFRHEEAFRQELLLTLICVPLALALEPDPIGRALMIGALLLVLIVELLNSAIEAIVDLASPETHHLAKRAKDVGSAAVLLSLVNAAVVWLLVLSSPQLLAQL